MRRPRRYATPPTRCGRRPSARGAAAGCSSIGLVGAGLALALSEPLRKKVLDALFGAEEEFEYTSTTAPAAGSERAGRHDLAVAAHCGSGRGALGRPFFVLAGRPARVPARGSVRRDTPQAGGREGAAHRRSHAPERRRPRRRGLDLRHRRARGRASPAGCSTTTSAPRSGSWSRSSASTATRASRRSRSGSTRPARSTRSSSRSCSRCGPSSPTRRPRRSSTR